MNLLLPKCVSNFLDNYSPKDRDFKFIFNFFLIFGGYSPINCAIFLEYSFFMSTREIFRQNLKRYRKEKGLSQEKLSELIGFGETYITEIESRHKFPKPETIDIIAQKLDVEPYLFFKPADSVSADEEKQRALSEAQASFSEKLRLLQQQINDLFEISVD